MCRKTHQAMVFAHSFNPTWFFVHEIRPIWRSHRPLRQAGGNHMFVDSGPLDPAKQFLSDSLELPLSFVLALSAYAYQRSVSLVLAIMGSRPGRNSSSRRVAGAASRLLWSRIMSASGVSRSLMRLSPPLIP